MKTNVWNSKETAKGNAWYRNDAKGSVTATRRSAGAVRQLSVPSGTPKEKLPKFIEPELALQSDDSAEWCWVGCLS